MRLRLRAALALLFVAVIAGLITVVLSIHRAGDPGRLDVAQWRRLTERFTQRTRQPRPPPPSTPPGAGVDSAPAAPQVWQRWPPVTDPATLARQAAEFSTERAKTVVELQQLRHTQQVAVRDGSGGTGVVTLINLNPGINEWFLLRQQWDNGKDERYHLVNARPAVQDLELDPDHPGSIVVVDSTGRFPCELWSGGAQLPQDSVARARTPYLQLCGERIVLRRPTTGHKTALEWSTDFLRDNVWGGEKITVVVRQTLFQDSFIATSQPDRQSGAEGPEQAATDPGKPPPLRIDPAMEGSELEPVDLGLSVSDGQPQRLVIGRWYAVLGSPGVFVSVIQPGLVAPDILSSYRAVAGTLDEVERNAQAILVAFDLSSFELGFSVGTDHPRVGWSQRAREEVRDPALPGPDGIGEIAPLVATGIIPPAVADRVAATFTGGFKRAHGAFKSSPLAFENRGSHYGFVESGVVLSKLQPGLATLFVDSDGRVGMRTWTAADSAMVCRIRHARQNGVPLVEPDPDSGEPRPGALVARWGHGNWSGSQDSRFRTLRAGACLRETEDGRFLVYGYFSSATPTAMARVFQACGCRYAMQLDINALEHTYLAVYQVRQRELLVEHLVTGMSVLDKQLAGQVLPRFLGFADNRDFFYLLRRRNGGTTPQPTGEAPVSTIREIG